MRAELWEKRFAPIKALAETGISRAEIARKLNLSYTTVDRYLVRFDQIVADKRKRQTDVIEAVKRYADEGLTRAEVAKKFKRSYAWVVRLALKNGIEFTHAGRDLAAVDRAKEMADMYKSGATLQQIGDQFGLTRERVRQLMTGHLGVTGKDGGGAVRRVRNRARREARRDQKSFAKYGCCWADYVKLRSMRKPTRAFSMQKRNAKNRGIEWNLTLWDWWTIWEASGRWGQRGRRKHEYVMCRLQDAGAYEVGNVYIATCHHNCSVQPNNPYRAGHPDHEKVMAELAKAGRANSHKGCSVDGCDKPHYAKTLCRNHYSSSARRKQVMESIAA